MSIDKKIDYVEQDGSLNFIKNSESVTVPKRFKARKEAPAVKLAYITDAEAKMLKKQKPGTPHKGPKGIPSYDSFGSIDASGKDTGRAGEDVSSAERGDFRGFEGSRNLPPGVQPKPSKEAQAFRNQFIAAGGGQRVNPGFFDSRNTVSPAELRAAKAFNPAAFKAGRRGGIMDLFTGGGFLGNIVRGIGQAFGLGKKYNEPTYDMSQYSAYGLGGSQTPAYYDDLGNELMLATTETPNVAKGFVTATGTNYPGANKFVDSKEKINYGNLNNFGLDGYMTNEMFEEQFGGSNLTGPDYLKSFEGLYSLPEKEDFLGNTSEDYQITPNSINAYQAKVTQDDINRSKSRAFKSMDYDTYKMIVPNTEVTPYEFEQLKKGNITEPGTYTV